MDTKLQTIAEGAEVNVQSDWNQQDEEADDFIKNKPDLSSLQERLEYLENKIKERRALCQKNTGLTRAGWARSRSYS